MYFRGFIVLALLCAFSTSAHAIRPVRCAGRIQFRPCDQSVPDMRAGLRKQGAKTARVSSPSATYAEIVESRYRSLNHRDGRWEGRVNGRGYVELTLLINQAGRRSTRQMGGVELEGETTSFAFVSSRPNGNDWSWQILTAAR